MGSSRGISRGPGAATHGLTIGEIDGLAEPAAVAALAPLFEGASGFLRRLVAERPFGSWDRLFARAEAVALAMPEDEQLALIDAHPRLGAPPASVSQMSFAEQGYDRDTTDAIEELDRLNRAYEARFGFRYCVFVAGRSRAELVPEMRVRLEAEREPERERALRDVVAIARDRHRTLLEGQP